MAKRKDSTATAERTSIEPPYGVERQPVDSVVWVEREKLFANGYNPNHVASAEMRLLKISMLADGWTQPVVARTSGEIVDGFHRWTLSADSEVGALTGGLVPVVYLRDDTPLEHQMMSTVRHNRARGTHHVVKMSDIVVELNKRGMEPEEIGLMMQMDPEEVQRFLDHGSLLKHIERKNPDGGFNNGWTS